MRMQRGVYFNLTARLRKEFMMTSKKNIVLFAAAAILLTILIIQVFKPDEPTRASDEQTPTVFIHGYRGTVNSFEGMLDRFQSDYEWGEKTHICTSKKGTAACTPLNITKAEHPMIQVYFENNDADFENTSVELGNIMKLLKEEYGYDKVNIVAHSMGGLVSVNYIQETKQEKEFPKVEKLVTIGTPFKGIEREVFEKRYHEKEHDLIADSKALQELYAEENAFDPRTKVYSLAGKISEKEDGDGLVSVQSATAFGDYLKKSQYREHVVVSKKATHNGLHENKQVDAEVGRFLWEK